MSYASLVGQACATTEECFQRMRDFLCKRNGTYDYSSDGIGWTLHDSSYATDEDNLTNNDWIVLYSAGESGDEDIYLYLKYTTATYWLGCRIYHYWNSTTHAGVNSGGVGDYLHMTNGTAAWTIWLYGDLDAFSIVNRHSNTVYEVAYYGKTVDLLYDDTVATCSSALTAGTDVSIALDAVPSTWKVGQNIFIRDNADIEKIEIKSIVGNTITADLTNSYAAGSKSAADVCYTAPRATSLGNQYGIVGHDGTVGGYAATIASYLTVPTFVASNVPDLMNDAYMGANIGLYDTAPDGFYGFLKNVYCADTTGKTALDVLTLNDGTNYRYFLFGSYAYLFKEV